MKKLLSLLMALALLLSCLALAEEDIAIVVSAQPLILGDYGEEVANVQLKLSELYYYDGEITGSYGDLTQAAVMAFQADFGLPATGEADAATQELLFTTDRRPLRLGSTGNDVLLLQMRLTALGYYTGKLSGTYLPATEEAVATFQLYSGESATGEADVDTLALLFSEHAVTYEYGQAHLPTPSAEPEPTASPEPTEIPYVKTLKYEMSGDLVKQVQQRLTDLGYYTHRVSGNYLGNTRNAVKAFQEQNALKVDGICGQDTWNALFNDPDVRSATDEPKPKPPVPYAITVDVTNQVTTVYGRDENGDYTIVVRQMLCSTGTKAYPSDVGEWVLTGRVARWCEFPQWGGYAQFWTRINSSIAFHSVIYSESANTMSLQTKSYNNLGKRASHGCIRLTVADAKWIYDNCGEGTVVTITEDLPADPELVAALKLPSLNKEYMLPYVTPTPTPAPVYQSGTLPEGEFRTLKKNSTGEDVYWLQSKLAELGYYQGHIGGTYLDGTVKAVKAFQQDHGLSVTGQVDKKTWNAIYAQELATPTPTPPATPTPTPTPTPSPTPAPMATPAPV